MGLPTLKLRGGSYHWRRKITVSGAALPLCLSLGTGNLSFRGLATTLLKGHVEDSVRCDIFGHEGETETAQTYDEEAELTAHPT